MHSNVKIPANFPNNNPFARKTRPLITIREKFKRKIGRKSDRYRLLIKSLNIYSARGRFSREACFTIVPPLNRTKLRNMLLAHYISE